MEIVDLPIKIINFLAVNICYQNFMETYPSQKTHITNQRISNGGNSEC